MAWRCLQSSAGPEATLPGTRLHPVARPHSPGQSLPGREAGLRLRANPEGWQCWLGGNSCGAQDSEPGRQARQKPRHRQRFARFARWLAGKESQSALPSAPSGWSAPCQGSRPAWRTAGPVAGEEPPAQGRESGGCPQAQGAYRLPICCVTLCKSLPHPGS